MAKTLSYADAVKLLGGGESKLVAALDAVTGGLLLGTVPVVPAVLGWFDARAEFVRLGHQLVRAVAERRNGLSRYDRTRRIEAAHSVLVVTAFFEALAAADLPFRFADLDLTRAEQEVLSLRAADFAGAGMGSPAPLPQPHESEERFRGRLRHYYGSLLAGTWTFIRGLAIAEAVSEADYLRGREAHAALPERAVERYGELSRRLAADFPEVALWTAHREHAATRVEVQGLGEALSGLHRLLTDITTGRVPDQRRAALATAYRAALDRPVLETADVPPSLRIPTLTQAYVQPLFRVAPVGPADRPSDESWWTAHPVRVDLAEYITGFLTSPRATVAPLLVLGQPGSGKSVLTRILAARLPPADFLPVRVALREVQADADLQDQVEDAVRAATGERLEWPALVRTAGDALPVVLLDGFDELLQATGVSHTDYLVKIAQFQRREADQGRPLAVLVTSRTSVADRARPPQDTVALRLEPFDDARISAWLSRWNAVNAGQLAARGLRPLPPAAVLRHRELAAQPLLLLMLALYDADGNALQHLAGDLGQGELYERLLRDFAVREVTKHRPGLGERDLDRAVDLELRRLSVVGLAMFNRGVQWVTEPELEADLAALFGPPPMADRTDLRGTLGAAETALGRFFFVHRSQASRDGIPLRTYEFLHATFGEFLVARLAWQALREIAAREAVATLSLGAAAAGDDLLHALLSYAPLSSRAPVVAFLGERAAALPDDDRAALVALLARLFQAAHQPRPARAHPDYRPRRLTVPARHAAYGANLVLLAVCVAGELTAGELLGLDADPVAAWHREALLWRSQLDSGEWSSIVDALALHRIRVGGRRDLRLALAGDDFTPEPIDPAWTYDVPAPADRNTVDTYGQHGPEVLSRKAHLACGNLDDVTMHALAPLLDRLGGTVNTFCVWSAAGGSYASAAHTLLDAWLLPLRQVTGSERRAAYERCVEAVRESHGWSAETEAGYTRLLLDRLTTDSEVTPETVGDVLDQLAHSLRVIDSEQVVLAAARCGLAFLGMDPTANQRIASGLDKLLPGPNIVNPRPVAEAWVRMAELDEAPLYLAPVDWPEWPDLTERMAAALRRSQPAGSSPRQ